ncbi:MAG: hypothetical protein GXO29_04570 [Thermotogae bacterium]|nr:hypothetical protein [Thermotogota bacterium]
MLWIIGAGNVILAPTPPESRESTVGVWVSSFLREETVSDFSLTYGGSSQGNATHFYGVWSDPQRMPSAHMILGYGDASDLKEVVLYVKGTGKYRIQLLYQRGEQHYMTQRVVEASDDWSPVVLNPQEGVAVVGGLLSRPGTTFPLKVVILPYANKETGEVSRTFDLSVSPVFTVR